MGKVVETQFQLEGEKLQTEVNRGRALPNTEKSRGKKKAHQHLENKGVFTGLENGKLKKSVHRS